MLEFAFNCYLQGFADHYLNFSKEDEHCPIITMIHTEATLKYYHMGLYLSKISLHATLLIHKFRKANTPVCRWLARPSHDFPTCIPYKKITQIKQHNVPYSLSSKEYLATSYTENYIAHLLLFHGKKLTIVSALVIQ